MKLVGGDALAFFDAAAPIVDASTLDMDVLFSQSRYEEQGSGDYRNAPLDKEEYEAFIEALTTADRVVLKDFEGGGICSRPASLPRRLRARARMPSALVP